MIEISVNIKSMKNELGSLEEINLDNYKGVLIDIDGTLYNYDLPHNFALQECYKLYCSMEIGSFTFKEFSILYRNKRTEITKRLEPQGACRSRLLAFQLMFEELRLKKAYVLAAQFEEIYWESFIDVMNPSKEIVKFLETCKEKNIRVCAISDMQTVFQVKKIQKLKLTNFIDFLVTSEESGEEKPRKSIFKMGLAKLGMPASVILMIGDSEAKDIIGAENNKIKSFRYEA